MHKISFGFGMVITKILFKTRIFSLRCNLLKCLLYFLLFLLGVGAIIEVKDVWSKYYSGFYSLLMDSNTTNETVNDSQNAQQLNNTLEIKYILLWTDPENSPFVYLENGQSVFIKNKCKWTNCHITGDRGFLGDYTEFEAIVFHGPELGLIYEQNDLPKRRHAKQKYVFANIESAAAYPICNKVWDGFFNWTWTYRLNSDALWGYVAIRDADDNIIGPSENMYWRSGSDMDQIDDNLKKKLLSKSRAAAWFVSNCNTMSNREEFVHNLQQSLKVYNLSVDIYGDCGLLHCPRSIMHRCLEKLEKDYYFYLAFENALSEDYVTEKIVYSLNSNTIPIVYGGANYSRFMPPGAYLNARQFKEDSLARKMYEMIRSPSLYQQFFKWQKYYKFHFRNLYKDTNDYCKFCAMINDPIVMSRRTIYENFTSWWSPENYCKDRFVF